MPDALVVLAGILTVFCAIGVIASREAVYSALFLTVHLLGVGSLFLALTHQFLAVAQLLVYAGAVMVVFMFAVTTLSPREDPLKLSQFKMKSGLGLLSGGFIFALLWTSVSNSEVTGRAASGPTRLMTVQQFALDLFGPFLLPFEGTAFLLLVALIGAVILGGRESRPSTVTQSALEERRPVSDG